MISGLDSAQIDDLVDAYAKRLVDSMTHKEMECFIHDNCIETFRFKPQEEIFDDIHLNLGADALNDLLKEINVNFTLEKL
tara:strand:+ start:586 stop:825 length:240 start_codon:yes stop_codon:yes gene_type:complete